MLRGPLATIAPQAALGGGTPAPHARRARRAIATALILALLPALAAAQADGAGFYRASSELNIRSGPSVAAELLGIIPPEGRVAVSGCDAFGWCQVRYENIDGWAARQFLVRTGDLPVDAFSLRFEPPTAPAAGDGAMIEVIGLLTPGVPCATLRTNDGEEFAVIGNVPFVPADTLRVLGERIATNACGTDAALAVLYVRVDR